MEKRCYLLKMWMDNCPELASQNLFHMQKNMEWFWIYQAGKADTECFYRVF